jgi:hypothetical protein
MRLGRLNIVLGALASSCTEISAHAETDASKSVSLSETGPTRNVKLDERKKAHSMKLRESGKSKPQPSRHAVPATPFHNLATDIQPASSAVTFDGTWKVGEWGGCQVNCGTGSRYRVVTCVDLADNLLDNRFCDEKLRPSSRQACEGDCARCDVNAQFLKGVGAKSLITNPIRLPADPSDVMCVVQNSFTCCSQAVEQQLLISHYQLRRGLKAQTQHRDKNIERLDSVYQNITDVISERVDAAMDATDRIAAAIDEEPITKTPAMESMDLLRQSLMNVLNQRADSLYTAQSDLAVAQSELLEQMDLMNSSPDDDEPEEDLLSGSSSSGGLLADISAWASDVTGYSSQNYETANFDDSDLTTQKLNLVEKTGRIHGPHNPTKGASLLQTRGKVMNFSDPTLRVFSKACQESISNYFISLSCAACNPSYPIQGRPAPESPVAQVPAATCNNVYSACADSLVEAHQHMTEAVKALLNSHANLITLVGQVQPILDRVWAELRFDWLPGFSSLQVAKPDLTRMKCVQDLKVFTPFEVSNSTDFCNSYLSFASPRAFVKRISNQLDRGLFAMGKFTSCDRCLHNTLLFLVDVLGASNKGSISLTLPNKMEAMVQGCTAQLPAPPRPSNVPLSMTKMTMEERVSSRVRFGLPVESIKGFSFFVNVSKEIVESSANVAPHEWKPRTLTLDAPVNGSKIRFIPGTKDTLRPMAGGPDAELQIHVMNQNCTKHSECLSQDSPSGIRPWWFCAHPNVCTEQPGACTDEGKSLLESGPKCVRGPCSSDMSGIDRTCPVNAICPAQAGSLADKPRPFFGQQYFSKFDLKLRADDPLGTARGVCDCAFDSNGVVTDQCMYARCLAYANVLETTMTCNTGLVSQCLEIKLGDPECLADDTLSCTDKDVMLTYPPELPGECPLSSFVLNSDTSSSGIVSLSLSVVAALVLPLLM